MQNIIKPKPACPVKALILDDDDMTRKFICHLLEDALKGCALEIAESENGDDAIGKLKAGSFDLFMMDINHPGPRANEILSGTINQLAQKPLVVIISGSLKDTDRSGPEWRLCFAQLAKPWDNKAMGQTLKDVASVLKNKPFILCSKHGLPLIKKPILYGLPMEGMDFSDVILGGCCMGEYGRFGYQCPVDGEAFIRDEKGGMKKMYEEEEE